MRPESMVDGPPAKPRYLYIASRLWLCRGLDDERWHQGLYALPSCERAGHDVAERAFRVDPEAQAHAFHFAHADDLRDGLVRLRARHVELPDEVVALAVRLDVHDVAAVPQFVLHDVVQFLVGHGHPAAGTVGAAHKRWLHTFRTIK